jgi:hypothetical protein
MNSCDIKTFVLYFDLVISFNAGITFGNKPTPSPSHGFGGRSHFSSSSRPYIPTKSKLVEPYYSSKDTSDSSHFNGGGSSHFSGSGFTKFSPYSITSAVKDEGNCSGKLSAYDYS